MGARGLAALPFSPGDAFAASAATVDEVRR
jgi:hypothetical protein